LFKTFTVGVILGISGAVALLYFVPVVDVAREPSIITVQPNGGNLERFHVNLPGDRVMAGVSGQGQAYPEELVWPEALDRAGVQVEIFKVRNEDERVVGVASRIAADADGPLVEWALHLPARGTMYVLMDAQSGDNGQRRGTLHAGTREFSDKSGRILERFISASESDGEGRLELAASLVGPDIEEESPVEDVQ
jgi:hypothetical protein